MNQGKGVVSSWSLACSYCVHLTERKSPEPEEEPVKSIPRTASPMPEPSHNIREIIKQYQNRPAPEPKGFQPIR